jgi:hypothetical protein
MKAALPVDKILFLKDWNKISSSARTTLRSGTSEISCMDYQICFTSWFLLEKFVLLHASITPRFNFFCHPWWLFDIGRQGAFSAVAFDHACSSKYFAVQRMNLWIKHAVNHSGGPKERNWWRVFVVCGDEKVVIKSKRSARAREVWHFWSVNSFFVLELKQQSVRQKTGDMIYLQSIVADTSFTFRRESF